MKTDIIPSGARGLTTTDWLASRHSFSFGGYYNLARMGFGTLRVLNDDIIEPGEGFGTHAHENMEIISIGIKGALAHKDNTGSRGIIKATDVQVMSAGTGVEHSEFNASTKEQAEFLQIWIQPSKEDVAPRYDQRSFTRKKNVLTLLVSGEKRSDALFINTDASISRASLAGKKIVSYALAKGRGVYLFVISGKLVVGKKELGERDAIQISETKTIEIEAKEAADFILIDVPLQ